MPRPNGTRHHLHHRAEIWHGQNILLCCNKVMELMQHGVRTAHGDSTETYRKERLDTSLDGETQGKADDASVWNLESQTYPRAHREHIQGVYLPHIADPGNAIDKNNDAFVDNADNANSEPGPDFRECEQRVIAKTEESAQVWSELIEGGGGLIAHHKCFCQGAIFDNSFPPKLKPTLDSQIHLRDRKGGPTPITMVSSSCPLKGLGCQLAVDGSQCGTSEHEFEARKSQCTEFATRCLQARLDPYECHSIMVQ